MIGYGYRQAGLQRNRSRSKQKRKKRDDKLSYPKEREEPHIQNAEEDRAIEKVRETHHQVFH